MHIMPVQSRMSQCLFLAFTMSVDFIPVCLASNHETMYKSELYLNYVYLYWLLSVFCFVYFRVSFVNSSCCYIFCC